ncbi:DNA-binding response regulator [Aeromonas sp. CA23]|uniref:response regulator transcription factor n=1 Tax=Aeromonas sp. CA23 TaxID=2033032 RepID=UPI000BFBB0F4|nr:response regulator transcription factor [Aeromonas sp. CA23]ATL99473.1 DNA-binding response regulator [Aeromonas sp. CA23]
MEQKLNCVIVDDHPAILFAIRKLLENTGIDVVAECNNGIDAIKLCESYTPNIVILDIDIPLLDGFEVIKRLKIGRYPVKILVMTASSSDSFTARCFYAGANGYLSKADVFNELPSVVKHICRGYDFFSSHIHEIARAGRQNSNCNEESIFERLSERELSVLKGLSQGKTNMQIANELMLSNKTISTYKTRIFEKLGMSNMQDIIDMFKHGRG